MTTSSSNPLPVRTPMDVLQLDFPHYEITLRGICGKLFYLAEAANPHVQPRFAQAETIDRLRAKLEVPVRDFTTSTPSIPRVWDYLLGGKENFAADRAQAETLLDIHPGLGVLARQAREFQARAIAHVAGLGIRQFLDLGCGLPTPPNTHETAQEAQPGAAVVYADNDELVLTHARLSWPPPAACWPSRAIWPTRMRSSTTGARQLVDFSEPVCLILAMTLHFFDPGTARRIVAQLTSTFPPGSYVIVCTGQVEGQDAARFTAEYQPARTWHHTPADLAAILDGLDLIAPGITDARAWRHLAPVTDPSCHGHVWAALARKAAP